MLIEHFPLTLLYIFIPSLFFSICNISYLCMYFLLLYIVTVFHTLTLMRATSKHVLHYKCRFIKKHKEQSTENILLQHDIAAWKKKLQGHHMLEFQAWTGNDNLNYVLLTQGVPYVCIWWFT